MIICMKMKEFVTNYLTESRLEDVKRAIFIPVSHVVKSDGSMKNVINGSEITPPVSEVLIDSNVLDTHGDRTEIGIKESLNNISYWFDSENNAPARKFLANMVKYSMKNPDRNIIILFDDVEAETYNYLNFYREYFYARYEYPCIIAVGGGMKLQERDKFLLMETIIKPNKSHLKRVKEKVESDLYDFHLYRQKKWSYFPRERTKDFSRMSKKELYKECQYVISDLKDKSCYDKEELIAILSEYYGTGISDEEIMKTDLYKQLKAAGINIVF